jgi:cyclic pyranopterin phosphate synthase
VTHAAADAPPRAPLDARGRVLRDLRVSVTDRCNFRCSYCMPAEVFGERYAFLPRAEILTFEEIERLARLFARLGARKLRLTGGEPLVRAELPRLVARLAGVTELEDLALTTNGFLLPGLARPLGEAGLRRVTVSLDSLDPDVFRRTSGSPHDPGRVLAGIAAAEAVGLAPIKVNCVVQRGVNEADVVSLARHFRGSGHVLRFIEYMDVGTRNDWNLARVVSAAEILERVDALFPLEPLPPEIPGEVATRYRYRDGAGEIGVVASVTRPFCGGCTRARLTADGRLVTCLFASGGVDLKTTLRAGADDAELLELIAGTWSRRADRYSEERSAHTGALPARRGRVEMYQVGG